MCEKYDSANLCDLGFGQPGNQPEIMSARVRKLTIYHWICWARIFFLRVIQLDLERFRKRVFLENCNRETVRGCKQTY